MGANHLPTWKERKEKYGPSGFSPGGLIALRQKAKMRADLRAKMKGDNRKSLGGTIGGRRHGKMVELSQKLSGDGHTIIYDKTNGNNPDIVTFKDGIVHEYQRVSKTTILHRTISSK